MAGIMNCMDYFATLVDETLTEAGILRKEDTNINPPSQEAPKNNNGTISCNIDGPDEEYVPLNPPRTTLIHRHAKPTILTIECVDEEHSIYD